MSIQSKIATLFRLGPVGAARVLRPRLRWFCMRAGCAARDFFGRAGFRRKNRIHVLYITTRFEMEMGQTARYRIHNMRGALRGQASTRFEAIEYVHGDSTAVAWADLVVLMRTTFSDGVDELIQTAKGLGKPVVFDIDDIIFLPEYAVHYAKSLGDLSEENIAGRRGEFECFYKTFERCDYATASTDFIANQMERAGTRAFVIHNSLNKKQLQIAKNSRIQQQSVRAISYLSGTKTHDKDFAQAEQALERIVAEYPDVVLRVAGYLDISPALEAKTQRSGFMSWEKLMEYGAQNYINIAPLDVDNPFCHAKSELKYFEAAAVGVPTVASPTDTFSRCIRDGENGLLASTDAQWYAAFKRLLDDKAFYERIAENAKQHALAHYSPHASAKEALAAYRAILTDFGNKRAKK